MLILASASLARRRLLKQAGISHHVMVSGVNEAEYECSSPSTLVESLALAKFLQNLEMLNKLSNVGKRCHRKVVF